MFCKNCGAKIREGVKFCEHCGTPTAAAGEAAAPVPMAEKRPAGEAGQAEGAKAAAGESAEKAKAMAGESAEKAKAMAGESAEKAKAMADESAEKAKAMANESAAKAKEAASAAMGNWKKLPNKMKLIAGGAVVVVLLLLVLLTRGTTVKLDKYVTISASGYDSYGRAAYEFDTAAFEADYGDKLKLSKEASEMYLSFMGSSYESTGLVADAFIMFLDGSLDQTSGLSNGDTITFSWDVEEEMIEQYFDCKVKYSDITYKVEGLEPVEEFDAFAGIEMIYTGTAPLGRVDVINNTSEPAAQALYYDVSQVDGLSNGDVIEVSIQNFNVDSFAQQWGMVPAETTKEYTVEGLGKYVSSMDEIPSDVLDQMIGQGEDVLRAYAANNFSDELELLSADYKGSYLLNAKSTSEGTQNYLYLIYKAGAAYTNSDNGYYEETGFYYYIAYENMTILPDGSFSVDLNDYAAPSDSFRQVYEHGAGWWGNTSVDYKGYKEKDELFNKCVTAYADRYTYESTVDE